MLVIMFWSKLNKLVDDSFVTRQVYNKFGLPGQGPSKQESLSISSPRSAQLLPPDDGSGFVHRRERVREPSPHVAEQADQPDHSV